METESGCKRLQNRGQQNNLAADELPEPIFCLIRGNKRIPLRFRETGIGRKTSLVV